MAKKIKRILTIDELFMFCQTQNFMKFSSKDTGYQLAVSMPTTFEVVENVDDNHRGMMKLKIKIFHDGLNRNNSKVPKESADKAMKTIPDRPVLAAIHQLDNGEWDFEGHEMELIENDDGELEINYIEKQVGSFSSEPPFWEHDDKVDKDFVCAYAYIPREYTKACDIIERKKGTKNSVELCIEELSFDTKDKCLVLNEFYVNASTLLGSRDDGTEIGEGMLGSRADIAEFSKDVNSVVSNKNSKEGGKLQVMGKLEELLAKYGKTLDDITFDYASLSDEELEAKFSELFDDEPPSGEDNSGTAETSETTETSESAETSESSTDTSESESASESDSSSQSETPTDGDGGVPLGSKADDDQVAGTTSKKKKTYDLSLQEKIKALSSLVCATYEEADNEWYCTIVYDDYVIMVGYFNGRNYKQSYKEEKGEFTLVGDRVEVFMQYLTKDEMEELENMKKEYSALVEFKANADKAEFEEQQKKLLEDDRFAIIAETEDYKALVNEASKYTLEELENKLKLIVADFAIGSGNFAQVKVNPQKGGLMFGNPNRTNPIETNYGGIFEDTK